MNILIIMPNYNANRRYVLSLGIMYVSSYLKKKGFNVSCLNLNHHEPNALDKALKEKKYDVVCTGGMFTYFPILKNLIRTVRELSPSSLFILGGPVASAQPKFALDSLKPDYVVIGEGEETTVNLLTAIENKTNLHDISGIAFYEGGHFVETTPAPPIKDLDSLPYPDYDGFEFGYYLNTYGSDRNHHTISKFENRRTAPIITGRGCPAKCTFCFRATGTVLRHRSIDNVIEEIKYLIKTYQINEFIIWDDLFSTTKKRVYEFCDKIKPLDVQWGCQLRVPIADEDLLSAMKEAGCNIISYGLESANIDVLKSMRKGTTVEQMEKALLLTKKAKMTVQGNFIFGDPAETLETIEDTLSFYRKHRTTFSNSIALAVVRPYPGTQLFKDLVDNGKLKDLELYYTTFMDEQGREINMTSISDKDFYYFVNKRIPMEEKKNRLYGKVAQSKELSKNCYSLSIICPLCNEKSDNVRIEIDYRTEHTLRDSFRLACPKCLQRFHIKESQVMTNKQYLQYRLFREIYVLLFKEHIVPLIMRHPKIYGIFKPLWHKFLSFRYGKKR